MTWLSVKMGLNFIVANDPNQMTLHFTFPVFRLQPTERWKWLTNGDGVGRNGKESESCLYLCRLLYYFRRSHRKKKKLFDGALEELLTIWQKGEEEAFFANKMSVGTFNFFFHLFLYNCPSMDK